MAKLYGAGRSVQLPLLNGVLVAVWLSCVEQSARKNRDGLGEQLHLRDSAGDNYYGGDCSWRKDYGCRVDGRCRYCGGHGACGVETAPVIL